MKIDRAALLFVLCLLFAMVTAAQSKGTYQAVTSTPAGPAVSCTQGSANCPSSINGQSDLTSFSPLVQRDRALHPEKYRAQTSPLQSQPTNRLPRLLRSSSKPSGKDAASSTAPNIFYEPTTVATNVGFTGGLYIDLNHDGIPDLVQVSECYYSCYPPGRMTGAVSVMLGNADGSFQSPVTYPAPYLSQTVMAGDFNNDGNVDLVVQSCCYNLVNFPNEGEFYQGAVSVLLGNGDGTFGAASGPYLGQFESTEIALGDFNGDGLLDVAMINDLSSAPPSDSSVSIFLGNGDGTLQAANNISLPNSGSIAATDLNGDGFTDLILGSNGVSVMLSKGNGTFQNPVLYSLSSGLGVNAILTKDVNGDGRPDVVATACDYSNGCPNTTLATFISNGDGTLQPPIVSFTSSPDPMYLATGDLNGDGIPDVAVSDGNVVSTAFGNGDGTFTDKGAYLVAYQGSGLFLTHINGDHNADIVVPEGCIAVNCVSGGLAELLSNGTGQFQAPTAIGISALDTGSSASILTGDLNGDGKADYAVLADSATAQIFLGNGDGTFQASPGAAVPPASNFFTAADVNKDGKLDLVGTTYCAVSSCQQSGAFVMIGNGDGTFQGPAIFPTSYASSQVVVQDLNGDGWPDVVVLNSCNDSTCKAGGFSVLLNNGDGTFQAPVTYNGGYYPFGMTIGDFNGDGFPDLIYANTCGDSTCASSTYVVMLGKGDGTFQPALTYNLGNPSIAAGIVSGDFNNDGKLDLAFTFPNNPNQPAIAVLPGNGDGTFQSMITTTTPYEQQHMFAADLNGDGKLDLVVSYQNPYGLSVYFGDGDGTFQPKQDYPAPNPGCCQGSDILAADFNGDGKPDVIVSGDFAVGIYLNQATPFLYATTTTVSSSANPGNLGQSITFTAHLVTAFNAGTPAGTLTFYDGSSAIGSAAVYNNQAALTTSTLSLGLHSITASYSGDTNYLPSNSAALTENITNPGTTTTLTSSLNPSVYGQSVTLTANVTSAGGNPTGSVTFADGAATIGSVVLVNGTAMLSTTVLAAGAHSITATYSGNSTFTGSSSAALAQTVGSAGSTLTLTSALNPAVFGQTINFTGTISPQYGGTATGTVTFKEGGTTLATVSVSSNIAVLSANTLSAATHLITASYSGDTNLNATTSGTVSENVTQATTTATVVSSANPAQVNESITFTATVSSQYGGAATNTVTFKSGAMKLGTITLSGNHASITTSFTTPGKKSITAQYSGDTNDAGCTSSALSESIDTIFPTTTTLTSSLNPSYTGQAVTFTATITSAGATIANGEVVTFTSGATTLGTGTTGNGVATFTTSALPVKTQTIKASYAGDATFATSSRTVSQTVTLYPTSTGLSSSPNPSNFGDLVTLTASVTTTAPGGATGTVTFKNGSAALGTKTLSGGMAVLSTTKLPVADLSLTASYNGDPQSGKSSGDTTQTVNQTTSTTALTSSLNPSNQGQLVKFTATVTSPTTTPTGTVTFMDGSTTLATANVASGKATFSTSALTAGSHDIMAVYNGTANIIGSTSSVLMQIVN